MEKNVWIFLGFAVAAAACGSPRTSASTQPTPAAFDPAQSDAKAIEVVDAMLAKVGGIEAWNNAKQITWDVKYIRDGQMTQWLKQAWDKWNGRHRLDEADMKTYEKSMAEEGNPGKTKWVVAMYDLLDHQGKGTAMFGNDRLPTADRDKVVERAFISWQSESYRLAIHYKLKDPGVKLTADGQVKDVMDKYCRPSCDIIKVTFDPAVGEDTYYISINTETKMPEIYEKVMEQGRIGFAMLDWVDVGGLKFATKYQNVGLEGEVFQLENIAVSEPNDSLYIPAVR